MKKIFFFLFSLLFFYSSAFADSNLDVNLSVDVDSNLDYVDNWVWVNIWQPLNYKLNFCNTSWNDLEFIMFRLYSTMWSNLEFVSNSLYLESISLPDWVFNSDMSVWNLTNWSCKNLFFALKPKQWWTLKTNDNVDYIAKYKYWVMATYLDSNTIWNPVSSVPVSMTISWPNSWTWSTQNITANINEWVVFYTLLDVWNNTCDNSVTFENTYTWTLSFDNEADNWKKACFKAIDEANNSNFKLIEISWIYKAPVVIVTPVIQSSWWGGWAWISKDYCPNWDYSYSYYDRSCWVKPIISNEEKEKIDIISIDPLLSHKAKALYNIQDYALKYRYNRTNIILKLDKLILKIENNLINYWRFKNEELFEIINYIKNNIL